MRDRSRTIASLFVVAMTAMLLGALITQVQSPGTALAGSSEPRVVASTDRQGQSGGLTLDTFREIAREVDPGVVNINTTQEIRDRQGGDALRDFFGDELMERFFGDPRGDRRQRPQTNLGSGFVIDQDGYILTNRHVVENADTISVTMNGRNYDAELVGRDARTDVALLKIDPDGAPLTPLRLGDSDETEVAEWVMAIGNPFGLGGNSVTVGVVSFKGRPLSLGVQQTFVDMIQTDASINPGNSGGPLLNARGEVIGINTLIITRGVPQSAGVGFAVPINVARDILDQLRESGRVVRGWLGVQILSLTEDMAKSYGLDEPRGAAIVDVTPGSPADEAGLEPDDVVIRVDGREVESNGDLSSYVASRPPGAEVKLRVLRQRREKDVTVTLGTFPDEDFEQTADQAPRGEQLGMTLQDLTPDLAQRLEMGSRTQGAIVLEVTPGEPADEAGLRRGDVIVSVNGRSVAGVAELESEIERLRSEGLARLRVWRGTGYLFVILRLS
jgi:serine protease Do